MGAAVGERQDLETAFYERVDDGVVLVTMNRPDHANGVVAEMARDMMEIFERLERDRSVRVLVLTGAGRQFCAGADLHVMQHYVAERLRIEQEPFNARVIFPVTQRIVTSRLPVIAAVNGGATAGGFDLALACDLRVGSTRAKFGETYIKIGMVPGNGGTYFLPRLIGSGLAAELALTGDVVSGARAMEIGLLNRLVEPDQLIDEAVGLAANIAKKPWRAIEATKQSLRASSHVDLTTSFNSSFWAVAALTYTDDFKEGIDAFIEKRPAKFGQTESDKMYWDA